MKRVFLGLVLLVAGLGFPQWGRAQTPTVPDDKQAAQPKKRGGVFTMYAMDPLSRTLCFTDGKEGMAFVNNKWENRCSDLSYTLAGNGITLSGNIIADVSVVGTNTLAMPVDTQNHAVTFR